MKKYLLLLLGVLVGTTSCKERLCENGIYPFCDDGYTPVSPGTYTEKSHRPQGIGFVSFSIGDKGYSGTGIELYPPAYGGTTTFYAYDPATDEWTTIASMPGTARTYAVGFATSSAGYVGGGYTFVSEGNNNVRRDLTDFWQYDPRQDSWTRKADLPGGEGDYLGFAILDRGYVARENEFWQYNPTTDSWVPKADIPVTDGVAFSIGPLGYVVSGTELWEYNTLTNQWTAKADFPGERASTAFATTMKGYVLGGSEMWEYDPLTNRWYEKGEIPEIREADASGEGVYLQPAFGIDDRGYFGIGYRAQSRSFYEFDPE